MYRTAAARRRPKATPRQSAEIDPWVLATLCEGSPVGIGEPRTLLRVIDRASRVLVGAPGLGHITPEGPLLRGFCQGNSDREGGGQEKSPRCVPWENRHTAGNGTA